MDTHEFVRTHARSNDKITSKLAAGTVARKEISPPSKNNCKGRILLLWGDQNRTTDELKAIVPIYSHQRMCDLERSGYIIPTSLTRPSDKGCPMTVYEMTDKGRSWLKGSEWK